MLIVYDVFQRDVLPVSHGVAGVPEVEGLYYPAEVITRQAANGIGTREDIVGIETVRVGEEFKGLYLLRTDRASSLDYVHKSLVGSLVGESESGESRVVFERAVPDCLRDAVKEVYPALAGVE